MEDPNGGAKSDHPHGFPDDIFRASGEGTQPEDPWIHHKGSDSADSETHSASHLGNPFGNSDHKNQLSFSSRSSSSSSADPFQDDDDQDHHKSTDLTAELDARVADPASSSEAAHEAVFFNASHTPPIQVMDHPGTYDPSRIPASVFTPRSSSPMDWSAASNESLFSLHVGNTSFNRDQFFMMGMDLHKSGELPKPDEMYKSGELFSLSPSPLVTFGGSADHDTKTPKVAKKSKSTDEDAKSETLRKEDQPPSQPASTRLSTISSHSDGSGVSGASGRSFAFPV
uniref:Uncharacterized protein n=1 Tax=Kalanchoe fedtschenkoi TaxID=63787 RepID=A0A7N1A036_KALFE